MFERNREPIYDDKDLFETSLEDRISSFIYHQDLRFKEPFYLSVRESLLEQVFNNHKQTILSQATKKQHSSHAKHQRKHAWSLSPLNPYKTAASIKK